MCTFLCQASRTPTPTRPSHWSRSSKRECGIGWAVLVIFLANPTRTWADWRLVALVGTASHASNTLHIRAPADDTDLRLREVRFDDESWQSPIYYAGRLAYFFEGVSWFGVEGEFVHLKAIARTSREVTAEGTFQRRSLTGPVILADVLPRFELSHGLNLALANVVFRSTAARGRITPMARVGVGPTIPHVEVSLLTRDRDAYQFGRLAWQVAVGTEVRLGHGLYGIAEFKLTRTAQRLEFDNAEIEGVWVTRHLVAGVGWHSRRRKN